MDTDTRDPPERRDAAAPMTLERRGDVPQDTRLHADMLRIGAIIGAHRLIAEVIPNDDEEDDLESLTGRSSQRQGPPQ